MRTSNFYVTLGKDRSTLPYQFQEWTPRLTQTGSHQRATPKMKVSEYIVHKLTEIKKPKLQARVQNDESTLHCAEASHAPGKGAKENGPENNTQGLLVNLSKQIENTAKHIWQMIREGQK